jgi:hypothetical protein
MKGEIRCQIHHFDVWAQRDGRFLRCARGSSCGLCAVNNETCYVAIQTNLVLRSLDNYRAVETPSEVKAFLRRNTRTIIPGVVEFLD